MQQNQTKQMMVKGYKKAIQIGLFAVLIFGLALMPLPTAHADMNGKLADMSVGDTVIFGGKNWQVLDPATGYLLSVNSYGPSYFNSKGGTAFDPEDMFSIAYLLNYDSFISSQLGLSAKEQGWIVEHEWGIGPKGDEGSKTVKAKIGLPSRSDISNLNNQSKIIIDPLVAALFWTLTPTDEGTITAYYYFDLVSDKPIFGAFPPKEETLKFKPALYVQPGLYVTDQGVLTTDDGWVRSNDIEDGSIVESKLQDGSVSTDKLQDGSVDKEKLSKDVWDELQKFQHQSTTSLMTVVSGKEFDVPVLGHDDLLDKAAASNVKVTNPDPGDGYIRLSGKLEGDGVQKITISKTDFYFNVLPAPTEADVKVKF